MQVHNFEYEGLSALEGELASRGVADGENVLVQCFVGKVDKGAIIDLQESIRSCLPKSVMIGATSAGGIIEGEFSPLNPIVSISVFDKATVSSSFVVEKNEEKMAARVASETVRNDSKMMVLFSDGLTTNGDNILQNLYPHTNDLMVVGGRAGDGAFKETFIFDKENISDVGAVAACVNGDVTAVNRYYLNWQPIGKIMTITDVEENILKTIDGQPVRDVYRKYLGDYVGDNLPVSNTEFPLIKLGPEGQQICRAIIAMTEEDHAVLAGNLEIGDQVRFSYGNVDMIIDETSKSIPAISSRKPEAIFAYSCAARLGFLGDEVGLELKQFNKVASNAGFFTFGEYYYSGSSFEMLNGTLTVVGITEQTITDDEIVAAEEAEKEAAEDLEEAASIEEAENSFEGSQSRVLQALITLSNTVTGELAATHKEVVDSINYASRIQRSVLASESDFDAAFSDHFVIWDPRDTVGGDMLLNSSTWGNGNLVIIGDCTGHGVPGAFVTLLANAALDHAMLNIGPGDVSGLVQNAHQMLQQTLGQHQEGGRSDDGIELGACYLQPNSNKMTFVGARFSLFVVDGGIVSEVKGTKKGMGYRGISLDQEYDSHSIDLNEGRSFFMTTDGYIDQVGGEFRRMFGKKRFKELLLSMENMPMSEQKERLIDSLHAYQGHEVRRDDVSMIGFKV